MVSVGWVATFQEMVIGIVNKAAKPFSWLPDWAWSYTYPNNVNHTGVPIDGCEGMFYTDKYCFELPAGVYPTSVYETAMMVGCFLFLWAIRKRVKPWGMLFSIYLIINGIERFLIETIRVNERYEAFLNLSQAQIIALCFVLLGVITAYFFWIQHRRRGEASTENG